mmetsp:Transcript_42202/g.126400  ORF Transcript_42202/g.126400 Transcript_42202/m.126400 type:complete len:136 (-) Transcript_42202:900-1307(-)
MTSCVMGQTKRASGSVPRRLDALTGPVLGLPALAKLCALLRSFDWIGADVAYGAPYDANGDAPCGCGGGMPRGGALPGGKELYAGWGWPGNEEPDGPANDGDEPYAGWGWPGYEKPDGPTNDGDDPYVEWGWPGA